MGTPNCDRVSPEHEFGFPTFPYMHAGDEPTERVPSQLPLVAIEILSPDDRHSEVMQKLKEYSDWGVPHIWLVDPERRSLHVYANGALSEASALTIPEFEVQLTGVEIFG